MLHPTNTPRPLLRKRILVTRTREQAPSFSERLRKMGATPVEFPVIRIAPPLDWQPLDDALRRLCGTSFASYDWLIFTSVNAVESACARLNEFGLALPIAGVTRVAAIGPATAAALTHYGVRTDLVPGEYIAEGVAAYRTLPVSSDDAQGREVLRLLQAGELHMLTFTSSSTVRNFMHWLVSTAPDLAEKLKGKAAGEASPIIACIGPITAQTARELGLHPRIEATTFTIGGLIEAIVLQEGRV